MDYQKINIFYAHTSRDIEVCSTYNKIAEELDDIANIYDYEKNISAIIGKTLLKGIKEAEILVIDITPDFVDGERVTINEHVMIELGYGLSIKSEEQIIIIYNVNKYDYLKNKNKIPVFIEGKQLNGYDYDDNDLKDMIINHINNLDECDFNYEGWNTFEYEFTNKFKDYICLLLNQSEIKLITRVNKVNRIVIIILTGINNKRSNFIEVNNYSINIKSKFKENDLSKIDYMLEELRHLQILTKLIK
jgi:hypothetical protein